MQSWEGEGEGVACILVDTFIVLRYFSFMCRKRA